MKLSEDELYAAAKGDYPDDGEPMTTIQLADLWCWLIAALILLWLAVGCGGGDEDDGDSGHVHPSPGLRGLARGMRMKEKITPRPTASAVSHAPQHDPLGCWSDECSADDSRAAPGRPRGVR